MIIIFGASGGIGQYLYDKFLSQGERVAGTYWRNRKVGLHQVDITDSDQITMFLRNLGDIGNCTVINCTGIPYSQILHKAHPLDTEQVIGVNLIGAINVVQQALPLMRSCGFGRIILFSSVVAQKGIPGTAVYAASKAGLWGLAKAVAAENASKGITINCINLGYSELGMGDYAINPAMKEQLRQAMPTKEFCHAEGIFQTVQFLKDNADMNGASVDVNGGYI